AQAASRNVPPARCSRSALGVPIREDIPAASTTPAPPFGIDGSLPHQRGGGARPACRGPHLPVWIAPPGPFERRGCQRRSGSRQAGDGLAAFLCESKGGPADGAGIASVWHLAGASLQQLRLPEQAFDRGGGGRFFHRPPRQ